MKYISITLFLSLTWTLVTLRSISHDVTCKELCQGGMEKCKSNLKIVRLANHDCMMLKSPGSSDDHKRHLSMSSDWDSFTFTWSRRGARKRVKRYIFILSLYDSTSHEVLYDRTCYSIESKYKRKQLQNSLSCQGLTAFPTVTNLTATLYLRQTAKLIKTRYAGRTLIKTTAAPTTAAADGSCSLWTPSDFHAELEYKKQNVRVKWDPPNVDVEVALLSEDNTDILSYSTLVLASSGLNTVLFKNVSSGTYVAVIRPAECFDCYYADYYGQPCNIKFIATEPFKFNVPEENPTGNLKQTSSPRTEVRSSLEKTTNINVILLSGMGVAVCLLTAAFASYCAFTLYKDRGYKLLTGGGVNFSKMRRIVLVYTNDNDEHLHEVALFADLLTNLGKQVIYPDDPDPQMVMQLRQNVDSWVDKYTSQTTSTLFVVIYSESLHKLYKIMDVDLKQYAAIISSNSNPFKEVAPRMLRHLKKKENNVIIMEFGFRDVNPLQSLSSSFYVLTKPTGSSSQNRSDDVPVTKRQINMEQILMLFPPDEKGQRWLDSREGQLFLNNFKTFKRTNLDRECEVAQ